MWAGAGVAGAGSWERGRRFKVESHLVTSPQPSFTFTFFLLPSTELLLGHLSTPNVRSKWCLNNIVSRIATNARLERNETGFTHAPRAVRLESLHQQILPQLRFASLTRCYLELDSTIVNRQRFASLKRHRSLVTKKHQDRVDDISSTHEHDSHSTSI